MSTVEKLDSKRIHQLRELIATGTNFDYRLDLLDALCEIERLRHEVEAMKGGVVTAMDKLREAGGDAWDDIADPQAFIREVTGESR